jgi:choline dehydrogenase-like flavoprotein
LNFSSFLHHTPLEDPSHRDPVLSLIFLAKGLRGVAMRIPAEYSAWLAYGRFGWREYVAHAKNIVLGLPGLVRRAPELIQKRWLSSRKLPSLIIDGDHNRFALHYHVEQAPHEESRVTLLDELDEHGVPRLNVDLQYRDIDVESILKAHLIIKERLEHGGVGTLRFLSDDPRRHIEEQISFGGHQMGTTRMAETEQNGVVDLNCRVFGVDNLYIAAPSVFPTGGQANPVATIVACAIRLADHLVAN